MRGVDRRIVGVARLAAIHFRNRVSEGAGGGVVGAGSGAVGFGILIVIGLAVKHPAGVLLRRTLRVGGIFVGNGHLFAIHSKRGGCIIGNGTINTIAVRPVDDLRALFIACRAVGDFLLKQLVRESDITPGHGAVDTVGSLVCACVNHVLGKVELAAAFGVIAVGGHRHVINNPAGVGVGHGRDREAELVTLKRAAVKRLRGRGRPRGVGAVEVGEGDGLKLDARIVKINRIAVAVDITLVGRQDRGILAAHIELVVVGVPQHLDFDLGDAGIIGDGCGVARSAIRRVLHDLVGEGVLVDNALCGIRDIRSVRGVDVLPVNPLRHRSFLQVGGLIVAHAILR